MNSYFYEDQVFTVDKKSGAVKFGLVVENEVSPHPSSFPDFLHDFDG